MSKHAPVAHRIARILAAAAAISGVGVACHESPTAPTPLAPEPVAVVLVTPSTLQLHPRDSMQLSANLQSESGETLTGRTLTWTVDRADVATVSSTGVVRGVADGVAVVTVTAEGITGKSGITVHSSVAAVRIARDTATIAIGGAVTLDATTLADSGVVLTGRTVLWATPDTSVASVDIATGKVTGVHFGSARIIATAEGVSDTATVTVQLPLPTLAISQVGVGMENVCELVAGGHAYCWGRGAFGAVGTGQAADHYTPVAVAGGIAFASLAVGGQHACALTPAGAAYCWGVLGSSSVIGSAMAPAPVKTDVAFGSISSSTSFTCGLTAGGRAYCWGGNYDGRLGTGDTVTRDVPTPVATSERFASIVAGETHTCAVNLQGAAFCWGDNHLGGLGDGTTTARYTPVAVAGGIQFRYVVPGEDHTCGLTVSGAVYCWGNSAALGVGATLASGCSVHYGATSGCPTPLQVAPTTDGPMTYKMLVVGQNSACALTNAGVPYCWGSAGDDVLGPGPNTMASDAPVPTPVYGGYTFSEIAMGTWNTCGLTAGTADLYCWGADVYAQLGQGSAGDYSSPTPLLVTGQP